MNIILYVVDSLRADHTSHYGYDRDISPNFDDFARNNISFDYCYSPSTWTRPVAASILSGWFPPAHNTRTRSDSLSEDVPLLSEILSDNGYTSVCISGMGNISSATSFDRGFDDMVEVYKMPSVVEERENTTAENERLIGESKDILAYPRAEDINNLLLDSIHDEQNMFLLAWTIDPHDPYEPPHGFGPQVDEKQSNIQISDANTQGEFETLVDLYDGEIEYWDYQFGKLIEQLKEAGEYENSIIWVIGDHGESFGERSFGRGPIKSHAGPPFEEQVHVPSVLKTPVGTSYKFKSPISLVDIVPTVLEMINIDPETYDIMGNSVFTARDPTEPIYFETQIERSKAQYLGVLHKNKKYIKLNSPRISIDNLVSNPLHLLNIVFLCESEYDFNLIEDPKEEDSGNLQPQLKNKLERELSEWIERCEEFDPGKDTPFDEQDITDQLDALGYR